MKYNKFLEHYRAYTQGNETPESMHIWAGLSAIAGASEKKIWIPRGFFNIYLNQYLLFVSHAGIGKSTAMNIARDLLEDTGAIVYEGATTKRMIVEDMEKDQNKDCMVNGQRFVHSSVTFIADEFNVILDSGGPQIVKFFTEIFSKENTYSDRTKVHGSYGIPRPFLNIMGNVVPEWFGGNLAGDLSATGLLARCIIVHEDTPRGSFSKPVLDNAQLEERKKALQILLWVSAQSGELKIEDEAEDFFDVWYRKQKISAKEDYRIAYYLERKRKIHVLRVAALMALGDQRMEIKILDFKRALHVFDMIDENMRLVLKFSGGNKSAQHGNKVIKMLKACGGELPAKTIGKVLYTDLTLDEIKGLLEQLKAIGDIVMPVIDGITWVKLLDREA